MSKEALRGAAAVAGVFDHPLRLAPDKSEWLLQAESVMGALDDAGLEKSDVDAFFAVAPSPEGGYVRESEASMVCDYLNLQPRFMDETDIGGAAFGLFCCAIAARFACASGCGWAGCGWPAGFCCALACWVLAGGVFAGWLLGCCPLGR